MTCQALKSYEPPGSCKLVGHLGSNKEMQPTVQSHFLAHASKAGKNTFLEIITNAGAPI